MAAHAIRIPPRRRWPSRVLGVLATAALLGTGVAIAVMVIPDADEEEATPRTPATAAPAAKPAKKKPQLTKAQKAARKAAVATLSEQGYEPVRLADYNPKADLRVLVGRSDTGAMRAFFFSEGEFVGNDDPSTSGSLRVTRAKRNSVTVAYKLTTGGSEQVRFELVDGVITATGGTVPPATVR
jgi:LppP/LprE lipoprotein